MSFICCYNSVDAVQLPVSSARISLTGTPLVYVQPCALYAVITASSALIAASIPTQHASYIKAPYFVLSGMAIVWGFPRSSDLQKSPQTAEIFSKRHQKNVQELSYAGLHQVSQQTVSKTRKLTVNSADILGFCQYSIYGKYTARTSKKNVKSPNLYSYIILTVH